MLDTNVFVRNFKTRNKQSPNRRLVRLWLVERRLQLIVSDEILQEYLDIFADVIGMDTEDLEDWHRRFTQDNRTTFVRLGRRYSESRDPDDNLMLATASAGRAEYLVTNDKDLLDLPDDVTRTYPFQIMHPTRFLRELEEL